jgi:Zn finger protein HypA/HybF involved in hydrogenase expression
MDGEKQPNSIFQSVDPNSLKPHGSYLSIYGEESDVSDVINLIHNYHYPRPLLVNEENTIVNGYKYWKASLQLGWNLIPVEVRKFSSPEAEVEAILLENADRKKTNEQKAREAIAWEEIEKAKARQRQQLSALKTNQKLGRQQKGTIQENFPEATKGQARDRVAELVGLGSGRNYSKAKNVVTEIDSLLTKGNIQSASDLRKCLNEQSIDAAIKFIKASQPNQKAEQMDNRKSSCWNCKHCSREQLEEEHSFYCNQLGWQNYLKEDGETRASDCVYWSHRLDEPKLETNAPNPSYFTLMLPSHLKPLIENAASLSNMNLTDWVKYHISEALKLSSNQ